jgi:glutamate synthase domain-containing protein 3
MNGAQVVVRGNAQDGVGNTMNAGRICVHGDAGDIIGYSMRGGKIFMRGSVGYRAGIHMKAYRDRQPIVVIGGSAADYLGEYMAGGVLVVLGLNAAGSSPVGEYAGTGMHGGTIYVRGELAPHQVGAALETSRLDGRDWEGLSALLEEFAHDVEWDAPRRLKREEFIKLAPTTARPYGTLYAY